MRLQQTLEGVQVRVQTDPFIEHDQGLQFAGQFNTRLQTQHSQEEDNSLIELKPIGNHLPDSNSFKKTSQTPNNKLNNSKLKTE